MKVDRVDSKTIRQRVYEQLRHRIIYGELLPGQVITLRQVEDIWEGKSSWHYFVHAAARKRL